MSESLPCATPHFNQQSKRWGQLVRKTRGTYDKVMENILQESNYAASNNSELHFGMCLY